MTRIQKAARSLVWVSLIAISLAACQFIPAESLNKDQPPSSTVLKPGSPTASAVVTHTDCATVAAPSPTITDPPPSPSPDEIEETASPSPDRIKKTPSFTQPAPPPSPSVTATLPVEETATRTATLKPGTMYLGFGNQLLFEGEGFAFETTLARYEDFSHDYGTAYSSISIEETIRGNVNLAIHSSRWNKEANPGEVLMQAYSSGELEPEDELRWTNKSTEEELTLVFVGGKMGIPKEQYEQFHELPAHLRQEIGREFVENNPDSDIAYLIKSGNVLTITTCDSRPGHVEVKEDDTLEFPERAGFVFVYY